jgi:hypothetical protein
MSDNDQFQELVSNDILSTRFMIACFDSRGTYYPIIFPDC